jgi:diguanylate cyclase (GGDEF)-like protein/PAS domain S-box-containing protein
VLNILSLISFANAIFLIFISIYGIVTQPKSNINQASSLECFLLAIWSFAYTFFYVAPSKEEAWFWMKVGSIGWIGFMGILIWFFLELARHSWKKYRYEKIIIIFVAPVLLILGNLLLPQTSAAVDLILSKSGLGWTYVNHPSNILLWLYVIYIILGILVCTKIIREWLKKTRSTRFRKIATSILVVDGILIILGFLFDIIIPMVTDVIPPLTNILLLIFSFSYWFIVFKQGVFEKTALEASEFILDTISDALFVLDKKGVILHCNQAASDLLKYEIKDIVGRELVNFYRKGSYDSDNVNALIMEKKFTQKETELVDKDGKFLHVTYSAALAEDDIHGFMGIIVSFHDVTRQKKLEIKLYELAHYDALTGLPNRRYFLDMLYAFEAVYKEKQENFALLYMDLDGFKKINDTCGHDKGDLLLIEVGQRLKDCIEDKDVVARIGGDEFVMLISNIKSNEEVMQRKTRIKEAFQREFMILNQGYLVGVSIGYILYSNVKNAAEMMKESDQRMYIEKTKGRE